MSFSPPSCPDSTWDITSREHGTNWRFPRTLLFTGGPYCLRFGSFVLSSVREGQSKGEMKLEVYAGCKKHPASQPPATEPSPPGHPHLPTAYEEFLVCPLCFSILGVIWLSRVGALWPSCTRFGIPLHLTSLRSKPEQLKIGSSVIEYVCVCKHMCTCM